MTNKDLYDAFVERTKWSQFYWTGLLDNIIRELQWANSTLQSPTLARAIDSAVTLRADCFAKLHDSPPEATDD